jgi:hypothetical protein
MYSKRKFSYLYVCFIPLIGRKNPTDGSVLYTEDNILYICLLRKKDAEDPLIIGRLYLMRRGEE